MENSKYITAMFPYPSGSGLHVGHWYNYAIIDSYCKLQRYKGYDVFQPFGFDSFGLPAENYAKKVGRDPKEVTDESISNFRNEMKRMNTDYVEMFSTTDPSYIKWTQWIFTKLYENGLAYKAMRAQSYCSSCETVLAREQVIDNKCERCNSEVVQKELNQWFFKITTYKDRLIKGLDNVDYPEKTKKQQKNWLDNLEDWCISRQRKWGCPIPIEGEEDTMDTFVDSSFYTVRYCDHNNNDKLVEYSKAKQVDIYVGGNEHACMHLIYSRFITMFLYDIGVIPFEEPFKRVIHQGMIVKDGVKMSKSKGNIVDPSKYDPKHLRMYLMFINHYFEGGSWNDSSFNGIVKFDNRMRTWMGKSGNDTIDIDEFKDKVISYFESWKTNKVISEWMIFYNKNKEKNLNEETKSKIMEFYDILG